MDLCEIKTRPIYIQSSEQLELHGERNETLFQKQTERLKNMYPDSGCCSVVENLCIAYMRPCIWDDLFSCYICGRRRERLFWEWRGNCSFNRQHLSKELFPYVSTVPAHNWEVIVPELWDNESDRCPEGQWHVVHSRGISLCELPYKQRMWFPIIFSATIP